MPFCAHCGKPYEGSPKFCAFCGRPLDQSILSPPMPTMPAATGPPRNRSRSWLWVGIAALVVVVAVVLVLLLVVLGGENGGDGKGLSEPEEAVSQFLNALEKKDIDRVLDLMDPNVMSGLSGGMDLEAVKEMLKSTMFPYEKMEFEDLRMSVDMTSDTTATVTIVAGSVSVTFPDGHTETEDVSESGQPATVNLVKVDGKWYMESTPFMGW